MNAVTVLNNGQIKGIIYMKELRDGNTHVYGKITGLSAGKHSINIHDKGDVTKKALSLGEHFNPFGKDHGKRVMADSNGNVRINYNRHVGDLGTIVANKMGQANINFVDPLIKLSGDTNVMGRGLSISNKKGGHAFGIIGKA